MEHDPLAVQQASGPVAEQVEPGPPGVPPLFVQQSGSIIVQVPLGVQQASGVPAQVDPGPPGVPPASVQQRASITVQVPFGMQQAWSPRQVEFKPCGVPPMATH